MLVSPHIYPTGSRLGRRLRVAAAWETRATAAGASPPEAVAASAIIVVTAIATVCTQYKLHLSIGPRVGG